MHSLLVVDMPCYYYIVTALDHMSYELNSYQVGGIPRCVRTVFTFGIEASTIDMSTTIYTILHSVSCYLL